MERKLLCIFFIGVFLMFYQEWKLFSNIEWFLRILWKMEWCLGNTGTTTNDSPEHSVYSQIRLKSTVSVQQIFQYLVRNKQFKFSRIFEIKTNLVELAELKKRAKIWTAYFWPKIGRSAARKWSFWDWNTWKIHKFLAILLPNYAWFLTT